VARRIDVGNAVVIDGEMQRIRRHHPRQQVMRRAAVRVLRLELRIAESLSEENLNRLNHL